MRRLRAARHGISHALGAPGFVVAGISVVASPSACMSKRTLLERMQANPRGDWTIGDVQTLCRQHGMTCRSPSSGSHYKVSHPHSPLILMIPARRPIKPFYIRELVSMCERATAAAAGPQDQMAGEAAEGSTGSKAETETRSASDE